MKILHFHKYVGINSKKKMLEYKLVLSAYKMTYFLRSLGQMVYHTCYDFKFDLRSSLYHPLLSAH